VKEELVICSLGVAGTVADYVTTKVGLTMPELAEMNILANPVLEGICATSLPLFVGEAGKWLKVSRSLRLAMMLIPASIPLFVAVRNLILIGSINARKYPISEFPLLYR